MTPDLAFDTTESFEIQFDEAAGGDAGNYNDLRNKPQINSVTLAGNRTAAELGIIASGQVASIWAGTQAEYAALTPNASTLYLITG